jgi:PAB1-binding protein PBP1
MIFRRLIWFSSSVDVNIHIVSPKNTIKNERAKALQEKQDWDQFKANEELFGVQSSYNEAAHSVWMDQGFVNVPFWGF